MKRVKKNRRDRPPSPIVAVLQWLRGRWEKSAEEERARVRAMLQTRLSAHLLKDIGLDG
jgi:hypothetical protein